MSRESTPIPLGSFTPHNEENFSTPEPFKVEAVPYPVPLPTRFKIKRRNFSNRQAPTDQFLASVDAADVPIPTIEEPSDVDMLRQLPLPTGPLLIDENQPIFRSGALPTTPVPDVAQYPDWSWSKSVPVEDRPTSSHSEWTNASEMSRDSGNRYSSDDDRSCPGSSEDGNCTSPEAEVSSEFAFKLDTPVEQAITVPQATPRIVLWTREQKAHLWSMYNKYIDDPSTAPFFTSSRVNPPANVIQQVARQTIKTWPGTVAFIRRAEKQAISDRTKSGSLTPTQEKPKSLGPWPHSSYRTRNQLRNLCKEHHGLRSSSLSVSPATARRVPPRVAQYSAFRQVRDLAVSLATSTAETMQEDGPLTKLTSEATAEAQESQNIEHRPWSLGGSIDGKERPPMYGSSVSATKIETADRPNRLASPFNPRHTYGPCSSRPGELRALNHLDPKEIVPVPRLRSPFGHARSLTGSQKRRAAQHLDDELSPSGGPLRPSILDESLFRTNPSSRRVRSRGYSLGNEAFHRAREASPEIRAPFALGWERPTESGPSTGQKAFLAPSLGPPPTVIPRLGSPFIESTSSNTFPRGFTLTQDLVPLVGRPYATMHHPRHSVESFDLGQRQRDQSEMDRLRDSLRFINERREAFKREDPFI